MPTFSKKHYEKIAKLFNTYQQCALTEDERKTHGYLISAFSIMFEADNKNFDMNKFMRVIYGKE